MRPSILLITTDEERWTLPRPPGFSLPGRERLEAQGTSFDRHYVASAMCSSSRSVIYTGQHMPVTEIYDNDNMPYVRPLDPELGTLGTMMSAAGYHCAYQGKWHLSNAYRAPGDQRSTAAALQPYGFLSFNDWGDIDGGAWAGLKLDPVIAGQAARWLRDDAPGIVAVRRQRRRALRPALRPRRAGQPGERSGPARSRRGVPAKLEALIDAEIGADLHAWVPERPRLFGWPTWHGDAA